MDHILYQIFWVYFKKDNENTNISSVGKYVSKIKNRVIFKIKTNICKVINDNSWSLYKNVPWSKVSSFKLLLRLKSEFLIYKEDGQVRFFVQVPHKDFLFKKSRKVKLKSYGLNYW